MDERFLVLALMLISSVQLVWSVSCESKFGKVAHQSGLGCGQTKTHHSRIFNGFKGRPGELPYQVRLSFDPTGEDYFCNGAIIDPRHILTTGHCIESQRNLSNQMYAIVGDFSVSQNDGEKVFEIDEHQVHENYELNKKKIPINDIAILRTRERFNFTLTSTGFGSVNAICLPKDFYKYRLNTAMYISGWGYTAQDQRTDLLQKGVVYVADRRQCEEEFNIHLENGIICMRGMFESACFGDEGAPLVIQNGGRLDLVGLFSYRKPTLYDECSNATGLYTDVSSFLSWIDSHL